MATSLPIRTDPLYTDDSTRRVFYVQGTAQHPHTLASRRDDEWLSSDTGINLNTYR